VSAVLAAIGGICAAIVGRAVHPYHVLGLEQFHPKPDCLATKLSRIRSPLDPFGEPGTLSSHWVAAAWPPIAARSMSSVSIPSRAA
jgi:hypothetical protein